MKKSKRQFPVELQFLAALAYALYHWSEGLDPKVTSLKAFLPSLKKAPDGCGWITADIANMIFEPMSNILIWTHESFGSGGFVGSTQSFFTDAPRRSKIDPMGEWKTGVVLLFGELFTPHNLNTPEDFLSCVRLTPEGERLGEEYWKKSPVAFQKLLMTIYDHRRAGNPVDSLDIVFVSKDPSS